MNKHALLLTLILITNSYGKVDAISYWLSINAFLFTDVDVNATYGVFNAGFKKGFDEQAIYAGLGLANFLQIQNGFYSDGMSVRFRMEILSGMIRSFMEVGPHEPTFWDGIIITPIAEKHYRDSNKKWNFGIGVGYAINY